MNRPVIGITCDIHEHPNGVRVFSYLTYARAIEEAGGTPIFLPPRAEHASAWVDLCDGFVLTGGDDPATEPFGMPTSPHAGPIVHPDRQHFETTLLTILHEQAPDIPVLGVCLGMQMMALMAGGLLDQDMRQSCPTHAQHWEADHEVQPVQGLSTVPVCTLAGIVRSKHHQAVSDPGTMRIIATAPDGIIEAIDDPGRRFFVGVQWHPERTDANAVGVGVYRALVNAAARA